MKTRIYIKKEKDFNDIAIVELFLAMLFSGSSFMLCQGIEVIAGGLVFLNLLVLITNCLAHRRFWKVYKGHSSLYALSVLIIVVFSFLINIQTSSISVAGRCVLSVVLAYQLYFAFNDTQKAMEAFVKIMLFFAKIGIVLWFLNITLHLSENLFPLITSKTNSLVQYNTIIVYADMVGLGRNCGPFWEPNIFSSFLIVAMLFSKFYLKQGKKNSIIMAIAIITAQSSGGFVLLALFIAACIWERQKNGTRNQLFIRVLALIGLLLIVLFFGEIEEFLLDINYDIFSKIFEGHSNASTLTRLESAAVDFQIWISSPIIGVGVDGAELMFQEYRNILDFVTVTGISHTSTSIEYLAAFGVGGIWINYLWIKSIFKGKGTIIWKIIIFLSFIILLNGASHINFVFTYFILFVLLSGHDANGGEIDVKAN